VQEKNIMAIKVNTMESVKESTVSIDSLCCVSGNGN
jgi:hypothetical protein